MCLDGELDQPHNIVIYFILFCVGGLWAIHSLELRVFWEEICCSHWLGRVQREWISDVEAVGLDHNPVEVHRVFLEVREECSTFRVRGIFPTWPERLRKFELVHFLLSNKSGAVVKHKIGEEAEKFSNIREVLELQLQFVHLHSVWVMLFMFLPG